MNIEATVLGDFLLPFFNFRIVKFFHPTALHAHEMIVMAAFIQFKDCFAAIKVVPHQQSGLLKLREHPVDSRQADVRAFGQEYFVDILGRHVALLGILKKVEHLQPGEGGLETHVSQFF